MLMVGLSTRANNFTETRRIGERSVLVYRVVMVLVLSMNKIFIYYVSILF